jgi:serpin B
MDNHLSLPQMRYPLRRFKWHRPPAWWHQVRPQLEALEDRSAPGDSVRSALFGLDLLAPTGGARSFDNVLGESSPSATYPALVSSATSPPVADPPVSDAGGHETTGRGAGGGVSAAPQTGPAATPSAFDDPAVTLALQDHLLLGTNLFRDPFDGFPGHSDSPSSAVPYNPGVGSPASADSLPGGAAPANPIASPAISPPPGVAAPTQTPALPLPPPGAFPPAPIPSLAGAAAAADAINRTAFDLFNQISAHSTGNIAFSPYSLATALTMAFAGARGQTAQQMATVLHLLPEGNQVAADFGALLQAINGNGQDRPYELSTADALWSQQGLPIDPSFMQTMQNDYGAPLNTVDFINQTEAARQAINAWAAQETNGLIQNLLPPGSVDPNTRLVLTNAAYFQGDWASPFQTVAPGDFSTASGQTVSAQMMNQVSPFDYADGGTFQALSMNYQGGDLSMVVLLPEDPNGLPALQQQLTADSLGATLARMNTQAVNVTLPAFQTSDTLDLGQALSDLGMPAAFGNAADFSGIAGAPGQLAIRNVIQKAVVTVNKEGTEAAAATAVTVGGTFMVAGPLPPPPVIFDADHPFLYLIRDNQTGAILFMGRVNDPTAS